MATLTLRALDSAGDPVIGGITSHTSDTPDTVLSLVCMRLALWRAEWQYDPDAGVPWAQSILTIGGRNTILPWIRQTILETPGVTGITMLDLQHNGDSRHAVVSCVLDTVYGSTQLMYEVA